MITIDTSAMLALLDRRERNHRRVATEVTRVGGPFLVPAATLGELGHFLSYRFSPAVQRGFLEDLRSGAWTLDCGDADLDRVATLTERYADLPLGLVDAAVIACAERSGGAALSLDEDFHVVAAEGTITVHP